MFEHDSIYLPVATQRSLALKVCCHDIIQLPASSCCSPDAAAAAYSISAAAAAGITRSITAAAAAAFTNQSLLLLLPRCIQVGSIPLGVSAGDVHDVLSSAGGLVIDRLDLTTASTQQAGQQTQVGAEAARFNAHFVNKQFVTPGASVK